MKSNIWCAFLIAMFLILPAASGAIMEIGDFDSDKVDPGWITGRWETSDAGVNVDGDDYFGGALGDGWISVYPTVSDYYNWSYHVYAYAYVKIHLVSFKAAYAYADVYAQANCPHGSDEAEAEVILYNTDYEEENPFDYSEEDGWYDNSGTDFFDTAQGVYGSHEIAVAAQVAYGYYDEAWSNAEARAYCSMSGPVK